MQVSPEAQGWDQDLVSLMLLLLALLPPCGLCQTASFLMVVKWLPSPGPYVFPRFESAYVLGQHLFKSLEEQGWDGSGQVSSSALITGNSALIG